LVDATTDTMTIPVDDMFEYHLNERRRTAKYQAVLDRYIAAKQALINYLYSCEHDCDMRPLDDAKIPLEFQADQ
jgi:hypothetical protein